MNLSKRLPVLLILLFLIAIFAGIYLLAVPSAKTSSTSTKNKPVAVKAPDFTFTLLDGKKLKLSDYQGKPVFLNFWASWCPPCREETPLLVKTSKKYSDKIQFLGVVIQDSEGEAKKFSENYKMNYPSGLDTTGQISKDYKITGIPTSYFITKDGMVKNSWIGAIDKATLIKYLDELEES